MSDSWLSFLSYLFAVVIGKRLRSPEKDAVVAQVFRDGFCTEYAYSRRICRLKIFSGKCPAEAGGGYCCSIISFWKTRCVIVCSSYVI